ncbi:SDR family NAD(P)-dependent oxidoreductase [Burkholderia glumae]|uniref:SDR family NAD(P)-dependent oxidoreductase n=1 Tax=Burkholderia glumae TaxID=337 RepID=UPI0009B7C06C|nr:SDR family oxidoreductase [Burkholderia glumae]
MGRLEGKKVFVTGGSRGIGSALVRGFVHEGAEVVFTFNQGRDTARGLESQLRSAGHKVSSFQLDASASADAAKLALTGALDALGQIDVLVNNVGVATRSPFRNIASGELAHVFDVNFFFPFLLTQAFCNYVLDECLTDGKANVSIINVSSLSAERATSRIAHYQCSKAAMAMLTKSVAYEMAPFGIRANTISPGLTATDGNAVQRETQAEVWAERVAHIPIGRPGCVDDHVGAAVFLASDESRWVTGSNITVDGGQSVR